MRRFKGSKKEFRGLKVALINYLVCLRNPFVTVLIIYNLFLYLGEERVIEGGIRGPRRSSAGSRWFLSASYFPLANIKREKNLFKVFNHN